MLARVFTSFLPDSGLCDVEGQASMAVTKRPPPSPDSGVQPRGVGRVEMSEPEQSVAAPVHPGFLPHSGSAGYETHQRNAFCLKYNPQL